MAKSKSGGTRSYIRGKIGADVYSIGKDGKGAKQQVVRSLAEVVSNPQTALQMKGRMIMSTVMQTVSALSQVIDHSFDGLPAGQPSISEFISRNYALIKADVEDHPSANNVFNLNKYQAKGALGGAYIVSNGKAALVPFQRDGSQFTLAIVASAQSANASVQDLLDKMGLTVNDKFTLVIINDTEYGGPNGIFARFSFKENLDLTAKIGTLGIANIFEVEENQGFAISDYLSYTSGTLTMHTSAGAKSMGIITSVKTANGWEHSKTILENEGSLSWTAAIALPSYPVGSQRFLNGGDL